MKHILVISARETFAALKEILSKLPVRQTLLEPERGALPADKDQFAGPWDLVIFDCGEVLKSENDRIPPCWEEYISKFEGPVLFVSPWRSIQVIDEAFRLGADDFAVKPFQIRELLLRVNALLEKRSRIVCIGGGTGLFTVLTGLKTLPHVHLSSIVSMSDSGGSSGRLRMSFGMLPPGDVRRSLVALSNAPELMNRVLQYRFKRGDELEGHNFGNLFLAALSEITGSMPDAIRVLSDILNIQGIVIPASCDLTNLVAEFEDGSVVKEEKEISECKIRNPALKIRKVYHKPSTSCNPDAYAAILFAHQILIGPGDLYTSIIANFAIQGVPEALRKTKAGKVYIVNVMTKPGETMDYFAEDHVREIQKYLGGDCLDHVLVSSSFVPAERLGKYRALNQRPVIVRDERTLHKMTKAKIVSVDIVSDSLLVRHDPEKLKVEIEKIVSHRSKHGHADREQKS